MESQKMLLEKVPYIRLWANVFNFKAKTNRLDFLVDFLIHIVVWSLITWLTTFIFKNDSSIAVAFGVLLFPLTIFITFLSLLSLTARRLNDIGYNWAFCFLIFTGILSIVIFCICIFQRGYGDETKEKKPSSKGLATLSAIAIGVPAATMLVLVIMIVALSIKPIVNASTNIEDFDYYINNVKYAAEFVPDYKNDLGEYTEVQFGYKKTETFFITEGITLITSYDETNYEAEKDKALEKYVFLEEPYIENADYIFPVTTFEYDGYTFKIAPKWDYWSKRAPTCKSFLMVGHNDSKSKIAYLYFYDFDIDYLLDTSASKAEIDNRMPKLIKDYFVWF